jgi:hypothetical protein
LPETVSELPLTVTDGPVTPCALAATAAGTAIAVAAAVAVAASKVKRRIASPSSIDGA